ncbi:hypothetical protein KW787_03170 [Candidatus Pacearchaeota archaeon]|nr:hypothetical protein [Candidatus Pacearchaeota archaeon]
MTRLEDLLQRDNQVNGARAAQKMVMSDSADERQRARDIIRNYLNRVGLVYPADVPIEPELVDKEMIEMTGEAVAERDNYYKTNKDAILNEAPKDKLKERVLALPQVKINDDLAEAKNHNPAYNLAKDYQDIAKVIHGVQTGETNPEALVSITYKFVEKNINSKPIADNLMNISREGARMALRVPEVAHATAFRIADQKRKAFSDYFEGRNDYHVEDYAMENLKYNPKDEEVIASLRALS